MLNSKEGESPQSLERLATISSEASKRLRQWGLTNEQIVRLRAGVGSYEYGNCLQKVSSIRAIYITTDPGEPNQVIIPHMVDSMRRKIGGECGGITALLLFDLEVSGFMDELRANDKTSNVYLAYGSGRSRTHFVIPGSKHTWASFIRDEDRDGRFTEVDIGNMIVLDGSFKEISAISHNQYIHERFALTQDGIQSPTAEIIPLLRKGHDPTTGSFGIEIFSAQTAVLGLSNYKRLIYTLGFLWDGRKVLPFIKAIFPNGEANVLLFNTVKGDFENVKNYADCDRFTPHEWQELGTIYIEAMKIPVKFDPPEGIAGIMTKKWR